MHVSVSTADLTILVAVTLAESGLFQLSLRPGAALTFCSANSPVRVPSFARLPGQAGYLAEEAAGNCRPIRTYRRVRLDDRPPASACPLLLSADWPVVHAIVRS